MRKPPRPITEAERLETIKRVGIISRAIPHSVRGVLNELSRELDVENCLLTVVGRHLHHVKAFTGVNTGVVGRDHAFCAYTILQDDVTIVEDADKDPRFQDNPFVASPPHFKFYAGAPLSSTHGHKLGAVCLLDMKPRPFPSAARKRLADAAQIISRRLGFYDDSADLSGFAAEDLARLIRDEADHATSDRLIALIDAYYARLIRSG